MADGSDGLRQIGPGQLARRLNLDPAVVIESLRGAPFPRLGYLEIDSENQLRLEAEAAAALDEMAKIPPADQRVENWEQRWGQIFAQAQSRGVTLESLCPKYFGGNILRLDGRYINSFDGNFEFNLHISILRALFQHYLPPFGRVVDLGCGSGTSLFLLSQMFPRQTLVGADWSPVCRNILSEIARQTGADIGGAEIDLRGDLGGLAGSVDADTAVISIHAFEQLGGEFAAALDFLLDRKPALVLQVEPLYELYDRDSNMDRLAMRYHDQVEYLKGYLPKLEALAAGGKIELDVRRRLFFGGLWHEAYGLLVWRPL